MLSKTLVPRILRDNSSYYLKTNQLLETLNTNLSNNSRIYESSVVIRKQAYGIMYLSRRFRVLTDTLDLRLVSCVVESS